MTAIRTSLAFALEDKFCGGPGTFNEAQKGKWLAAPPNSFFTHGHQRSTNRQNAAGTKQFDYIAYGGYSGTWSWSFTADYEYMEMFLAVFEDYVPSASVVKPPVNATKHAPTPASVAYTVTILGSADELPDPLDENTANRPSSTTIYYCPTISGNIAYIWVSDLGVWASTPCLEPELAVSKGYVHLVYSHGNIKQLNPISVAVGEDETEYLEDQDVEIMLISDSDTEHGRAYFNPQYFKVADVTEDSQTVKCIVSEDTHPATFGGTGGVYKHIFKKKDTGRVSSLCFRRVQLNQQVGGKHGDEILEIYGAVCTEFRMSVSAGSSQVQVNMSGFSAKEAMKITTLESTEYKAYDGEHVMFACLFNSANPSTDSYVADVQSLQVAVKNNAERLWSTCSPFMTNYYEGITNYEITANVYSKDPMLFRQRLYTGGRDIKSDDPHRATAIVPQTGAFEYLTKPLCKGLAPMPNMSISSYDTCRDIENNQPIATAIDQADFRMDIKAKDIVFKTMSWERGDSSKILDNLSSAECRFMQIEVYSDVRDYRLPDAKRYLEISTANMIQDNTN